MAKLTEKQKAFCREYVIDFNASQAALRAGFSKKNHEHIGWELLQKTTVQRYLKKLTVEQEEKAEISVQNIISDLTRIKKDCLNAEKPKHAEAIKVLELLGKHLGMWIENIRHYIKPKEMKEIITAVMRIINKHCTAEQRMKIADEIESLLL